MKPRKPIKAVLIGSGNVATHLGRAFLSKGHRIVQVVSRTQKNADRLAALLQATSTTSLNKIASDADLCIIAVSDSVIEDVTGKIQTKGLLVHTSGSVSMEILKNASARYGVLYPLQTFSMDRQAPDSIPFCIEGSSKEVEKKLKSIASVLSENVYVLSSGQRTVAHLAAVFACNFTNYMYAAAEEILSDHNIPWEILTPLIEETARKAASSSPSSSQTGPAYRLDLATLKRHDLLLREHPGYRKLYNLVSQNIIKKYHGR